MLAEAMVDADIEVKGLAPKGKLLTATTTQALEWGLADLEVSDQEALLKTVGLTEPRIENMEVNWAEAIARLITHPALSGLLMTFGFLGIMMEMYSPGFGGVGAIGLACLATFFFGHYVVNLAGFEELALFGVGVLLLLIELLVIPGFGFVGIGGIFALIVALSMALVDMPMPVEVSFDLGYLTDAVLRVALSLLATLIGGMLILWRLPASPLFNKLALDHQITGQAVAFGAGGESVAPEAGSQGSASTELRPSGKVRVDGVMYDAITSGEPIARGAGIVVTGTKGSSLVVALAPESQTGEAEHG